VQEKNAFSLKKGSEEVKTGLPREKNREAGGRCRRGIGAEGECGVG